MQALNPYLPSWEYIPDGEPHVFGERVYVYGSHDLFEGPDFCPGDYVCWSAPVEDLSNWRNEGVIYRKEQEPKNPRGERYMFAPDGHPWGSKEGEVFAFDPGGLVEIKGQWYIFYHRHTNKQRCCRQGCAEKITILPNGHIPQVEITSCGLNDGPLQGVGTYEARIACNLSSKTGTFAYEAVREKDTQHLYPYFTQSGENREENPDQYIANMTDGAWAGFKYFTFSGVQQISVRVRGSGKGGLEIRTQQEGKPVCVIPVKQQDDWQLFSANMALTGNHALYFTYRGTGYLDVQSFTLAQIS